MVRKLWPLVVCAVVVLALVQGCTPKVPPPPAPSTGATAAGRPAGGTGMGPESTAAAEPVELTVFAAASMTECLDAFNADYEAARPGVTIKPNYAGTQELVTQVEQGAKADVFVSASTKDMDTLVESGNVSDPANLAHNRLCVITEKDSQTVPTFEALAQPGVRIVVAVDTCPAGKYSRQCWEKLGGLDGFGADFMGALEKNVVSEETNVKLVVSKVALGEADAGFVYVTDATGQDVAVVEIPEEAQVQATLVVGVLNAAPHADAAKEYMGALLGELGAKHLTEAGFEPIKPEG